MLYSLLFDDFFKMLDVLFWWRWIVVSNGGDVGNCWFWVFGVVDWLLLIYVVLEVVDGKGVEKFYYDNIILCMIMWCIMMEFILNELCEFWGYLW